MKAVPCAVNAWAVVDLVIGPVCLAMSHMRVCMACGGCNTSFSAAEIPHCGVVVL